LAWLVGIGKLHKQIGQHAQCILDDKKSNHEDGVYAKTFFSFGGF